MDNKINVVRKKIRALRVSMLEAEAIMHHQINRDEECWAKGDAQQLKGDAKNAIKDGVNKVADIANKKL